MNSQIAKDRAISSIMRHIQTTPFLTFGPEDEKVVLCYRRRGEEIEYQDEAFEALATGIFRKFLKISGSTASPIFMRIGGLNEVDLAAALHDSLQSMTADDIAFIPIEIGMQAGLLSDTLPRP